MQKIGVTSTLTVYFDGQFWVGMFERIENGKLSACRIVFGAEPSDEEIQQFVIEHYDHLRFTEPIEAYEPSKPAGNPKRRQREVARELKRKGPSTKAQQAIAQEREASAAERKANARARRDQEKQQRYELRHEKHKQKHRGK